MAVVVFVAAVAAAVAGLALRPRLGPGYPARLVAGALLLCAVAAVIAGALVPALVLVAAAAALLARGARI